jgi:hypothetical protein
MKPSSSVRVSLASALLCTAALASQAAPVRTAPGQSVDCSDAYGGRSATCRPVPCDGPYAELPGRWRGQFKAYVREKSAPGKPVFRPYQDEVRYQGCLINSDNGEFLAVGHRHDTYPASQGLPAREESGLIITGHRADGTPFFRAVNHPGKVDEFALTYRNAAAGFAVWTEAVPAAANHPAMTVTTIDERDPTSDNPLRRAVVVTLVIGPQDHPIWSGPIVRGVHMRAERAGAPAARSH